MRVASRYLLPLEMLLAFQLIILAINGGFGGGPLYHALVATREALALFLVVGSLGVSLLGLSFYEWHFLRRAEEKIILASVSARAFCAFFGTVIWLGTAIFIVSIGAAPTTVYFMLLSPIAATFHCWCFVENMKVKCAIDHRYATPHLHFHR